MTTGRAQVNVITNDMTDSNNWESRKFGSSIMEELIRHILGGSMYFLQRFKST